MLENLLISIFLFLSVPGLFMTKNTQHVRFRFYFSFNILLVSFLPTVQLSISFKMKCLWLKTSYFLFHLLAFYNEGVWRSGHMKLLISEFPIKRVCKLCQAILSGVAKTFLKKICSGFYEEETDFIDIPSQAECARDIKCSFCKHFSRHKTKAVNNQM